MPRSATRAILAGLLLWASLGPAAARAEGPEGGTGQPAAAQVPPIRYVLERIEVRGNRRTASSVIRSLLPLSAGDVLDVDDAALQAARWRLLGTGWFDEVELRLRRGHRPGRVVLVVEVRERNTLVVDWLALGVSQVLSSSLDRSADLAPYVGLEVTERNLLGRGMELSVATLLSTPQQGVRLRFGVPHVLGSPYSVDGTGFLLNAREFFGHEPLVSIACPTDLARCPPEVEARQAVVLYRRGGLGLAASREVGSAGRLRLGWRIEGAAVLVRPEAASERRGAEVRPLDFGVPRDRNLLSVVHFSYVFDQRDAPALPSRGTRLAVQADTSSLVLGSEYDFLRLQAVLRHWVPLGRRDALRFGLFAGVIFGEAPFFYRFHLSDLSDLIPSRVLEMELDRRPAPNLLGTAIEVMRAEPLAARIDLQYTYRFHRGSGFFRSAAFYALAGLYGLARFEDLRVAVPGYRGLARAPVDLTADLGVRAATPIGVFQLGLSTLLGFVAP